MKRTVSLLLALVMALSLLSGCTEKPSGGGTPGSTNNPGTSSGDKGNSAKKDSITVSLGGSVTTLDPMSTNLAVNQMLGNVALSSLVDFDADWNVIPNVAESWTISDDGLTYTFKLRQDVKFHSGDQMKSEDVVFSVERAINSSFLATDWKYCKGAKATDDFTVEVYLNEPYTPFLAIAAKTLFVHNKSFYDDCIAKGETDEQYQMKLDGTGPYRFIEYKDGVSIEFEAFADYFKGEPAIKHWYGKIITDDNARALAIEAGDIDLIETHTNVPSSNMDILRSLDNVVVEPTNFEKVFSLPVNTSIKGFDNALVRKAMAYAIDYEWIIDVATNGSGYETECAYLGHKTTGFSTADTITHYNYDVEKAKALLAEAGYPNGEGLPVIKATIAETRKTIIEAVKSCWEAIGLKMELNVMESGVVLTEVRSGNFTIGIVSNNCMVDASMYNSYYTEEAIGSSNMSRYVNPELIALMNQAATELEPTARQKLFDQIWTIITDETPAIWLFYDPSNLIYAKGLHAGGVYPTQSVVRYEDMYWE